MRKIISFAACVFLCAGIAGSSRAQTSEIPRLEQNGSHYQLIVDGKPFLILGGQAHNSSASNLSDLEPVWNSLVAMHANTAEVPIYWNLIEPEQGRFDFHLVDGIIDGARAHGLRLDLLWFGSTKNATLSYVPDWIKQNPQTYFHAIDASGQPIEAISPFCTAARDADSQAFGDLMKHIRSIDESQHTVILMQVENEVGLIHTDRDYSPEAMKSFNSPVPAEFIAYLNGHRANLTPFLSALLQNSKLTGSSTWTDIFGDSAPESFSAWYVASYVDAVAAAGKQQYPIPYYVNDALPNTGSARAGDWPSGGPTFNVLDVWKAAAPHINIIAPDIYRNDFPEMAAQFIRSDNPLLVPETGFAPYYAPYVFTDLAGMDGIGFSPFGVDDAVQNGKLTATGAAFEQNFRVLEPLLPLISQNRYAGKLFPIVLNYYRHESVAIQLGNHLAAVVYFDEPFQATSSAPRAGGLIIELAPDDYIVAGEGFHVDFVPTQGPERRAEFLSIEEGTFEGDTWVKTRNRNGDEESVTLPTSDARILRVRLSPR